MTIKKSLLFSVSVLVAIIAIFLGNASYKALQDKNIFSLGQQQSETIDLLLTAAGNWAVERGVTNSGLNFANKAPDKMLSIIATRRADADKAYKVAMEQVAAYTFEGKQQFITEVGNAFESVVALRKQADANLGLTQIDRDASLLKKWVPALSKLIILSQDLRFALTKTTAQVDTELGRQAQVKHFSWLMSEYAGRERAILGGMIAANLGIAEKKLINLSRFRGNVESGWDVVQKLAVDSNKEVRSSVDKVREVFFGSYEGVRQSIYSAAIEGDDFPITSQEWISEATKAIDTVLALQSASTIETKAYLEQLMGDAGNKVLMSVALLIVALLVGGVTLYVVVKRVVAPINEMTDAMEVLASGDTTVTIPALGRSDEIGEMAASVQVFKDSAIAQKKMEEEQKASELRAEEDKKKAMNDMADSFQSRVQGVIHAVASASTELMQTAEHMTKLINESSGVVQEASSGAEQTTSSVQAVAAAIDEMSSTVGEISSQMNRSNSLVEDSVRKVDGADEHAQALSDSSRRVGDVVQLISDIAGQINLLALNATIESARAGDAGKGFAVVAGEVKNLADQTDKSIQEIDKVIAEMNMASEDIVGALGAIKESVTHISETSSTVAAAVEEQSATTHEISSSMQTASQSTRSISDNLGEVSKGAVQSQSASEQVLSAAQELAKQAEFLDSEVNGFLKEVKAS